MIVMLTVAGLFLKDAVETAATEKLAREQTLVAMTTYVERAESEVEGYAAATAILSEKYQGARDERDEMQARLDGSDLAAMLKRHPAMVEHRINVGTQRLFDDFRVASSKPRAPEDASPGKTRTNQPRSDKMEGS
jgi:hypothetical protein